MFEGIDEGEIMKNVPAKDEVTNSLMAPMGAAIAGFFVAVLLLLGIMGGYILGALILILLLVTAPIGGVVVCARWLLSAKATGIPEGIPQSAEEVPTRTGDLTQALRSVDIFRGLSDQELAEIAEIGRSVNVPQGTLLAQQRNAATSVYIILEGQAQLTTASPQGELTVRIAGPGESLPLAALIGSGRLITSAYAMSQLRGLEIPCSRFCELMLKQPQMGLRVYQNIADILGARYQTTLSRLVGTMEQGLQVDIFANV